MNADQMKAVAYRTIGKQFIIAIRHLGGLWYMANIAQQVLYPGTPRCAVHKNSPQTWYIAHIPLPIYQFAHCHLVGKLSTRAGANGTGANGAHKLLGPT